MKSLLKFSLLLLCSIFMSQFAFSQACTFVSPLVQVINSHDSTAPDNSKYCVQTITLSVDIDVNNGNKWTYIHLWRTQDWHTAAPTFNYGHAPTNGDILSNDLLTLALTYSSNTPPSLSSNYAPDPTENPQVQDGTDGITFTTSPSTTTPGATHFIFNNIKIVVPGVCDPAQTFKGDSWSSQSANGGTVQCTLQGFVFATSDPTATAAITCTLLGQPNILNFTVNTLGLGNIINFQFDIYLNTDATTAFDPNLDTKIYSGSTTYTVTEGTTNSSMTFNSGTIPFYPAPYSTTLPYKYQDIYVVIKNIQITNGATVTNISNSLVTVATNTCQSLALPVTFNAVNAVYNGNQLVVNWESLTEANCKEYAVEASKDGLHWISLAKIPSKAENGNSSSAISYSFETSLPITIAGVSIAFLLLFSLFKSKTIRLLLIVASVALIASCLKDNKMVDKQNGKSLYVRIAQYDLGGKVQYSKTLNVVNQ